MTEAGEPGAETGATADAGLRFRDRRVMLGVGAAAALVLMVGGVAMASGFGDDDGASPKGSLPTSTTRAPTSTTTSTSTTLPPTTTTLAPTTVPPAEPAVAPAVDPEDVPTPVTTAANRVPRCGLGPWGERHPLNWDVPGPPEQIELVDGPNHDCTDEAGGCRVTISTTWSDGVTASDARVLTRTGGHTLNDGRGTIAQFWVYDDLGCAFSSATYNNVWGYTP